LDLLQLPHLIGVKEFFSCEIRAKQKIPAIYIQLNTVSANPKRSRSPHRFRGMLNKYWSRLSLYLGFWEFNTIKVRQFGSHSSNLYL
jgi:hypothetical protein